MSADRATNLLLGHSAPPLDLAILDDMKTENNMDRGITLWCCYEQQALGQAKCLPKTLLCRRFQGTIFGFPANTVWMSIEEGDLSPYYMFTTEERRCVMRYPDFSQELSVAFGRPGFNSQSECFDRFVRNKP